MSWGSSGSSRVITIIIIIIIFVEVWGKEIKTKWKNIISPLLSLCPIMKEDRLLISRCNKIRVGSWRWQTSFGLACVTIMMFSAQMRYMGMGMYTNHFMYFLGSEESTETCSRVTLIFYFSYNNTLHRNKCKYDTNFFKVNSEHSWKMCSISARFP
jgi:hypothetical protein